MAQSGVCAEYKHVVRFNTKHNGGGGSSDPIQKKHNFL